MRSVSVSTGKKQKTTQQYWDLFVILMNYDTDVLDSNDSDSIDSYQALYAFLSKTNPKTKKPLALGSDFSSKLAEKIFENDNFKDFAAKNAGNTVGAKMRVEGGAITFKKVTIAELKHERDRAKKYLRRIENEIQRRKKAPKKR